MKPLCLVTFPGCIGSYTSFSSRMSLGSRTSIFWTLMDYESRERTGNPSRVVLYFLFLLRNYWTRS